MSLPLKLASLKLEPLHNGSIREIQLEIKVKLNNLITKLLWNITFDRNSEEHLTNMQVEIEKTLNLIKEKLAKERLASVDLEQFKVQINLYEDLIYKILFLPLPLSRDEYTLHGSDIDKEDIKKKCQILFCNINRMCIIMSLDKCSVLNDSILEENEKINIPTTLADLLNQTKTLSPKQLSEQLLQGIITNLVEKASKYTLEEISLKLLAYSGYIFILLDKYMQNYKELRAHIREQKNIYEQILEEMEEEIISLKATTFKIAYEGFELKDPKFFKRYCKLTEILLTNQERLKRKPVFNKLNPYFKNQLIKAVKIKYDKVFIWHDRLAKASQKAIQSNTSRFWHTINQDLKEEIKKLIQHKFENIIKSDYKTQNSYLKALTDTVKTIISNFVDNAEFYSTECLALIFKYATKQKNKYLKQFANVDLKLINMQVIETVAPQKLFYDSIDRFQEEDWQAKFNLLIINPDNILPAINELMDYIVKSRLKPQADTVTLYKWLSIFVLHWFEAAKWKRLEQVFNISDAKSMAEKKITKARNLLATILHPDKTANIDTYMSEINSIKDWTFEQIEQIMLASTPSSWLNSSQISNVELLHSQLETRLANLNIKQEKLYNEIMLFKQQMQENNNQYRKIKDVEKSCKDLNHNFDAIDNINNGEEDHALPNKITSLLK